MALEYPYRILFFVRQVSSILKRPIWCSLWCLRSLRERKKERAKNPTREDLNRSTTQQNWACTSTKQYDLNLLHVTGQILLDLFYRNSYNPLQFSERFMASVWILLYGATTSIIIIVIIIVSVAFALAVVAFIVTSSFFSVNAMFCLFLGHSFTVPLWMKGTMALLMITNTPNQYECFWIYFLTRSIDNCNSMQLGFVCCKWNSKIASRKFTAFMIICIDSVCLFLLRRMRKHLRNVLYLFCIIDFELIT